MSFSCSGFLVLGWFKNPWLFPPLVSFSGPVLFPCLFTALMVVSSFIKVLFPSFLDMEYFVLCWSLSSGIKLSFSWNLVSESCQGWFFLLDEFNLKLLHLAATWSHQCAEFYTPESNELYYKIRTCHTVEICIYLLYWSYSDSSVYLWV